MNRRKKNPDEKVLRDPQRTKLKLLSAARREFSDKGLQGARVDAIASRSGVNKQLLYYYFGDKEKLYSAVLEAAYVKLREKENQLHLEDLDPKQAMEVLVGFTFDYLNKNHQFVALLNDENIHQARHIKQSKKILGLHFKMKGMLRQILHRGAQDGVFRKNVDPVDLFISMTALSYFFISNRHTLSYIFDRNFSEKKECEARREHVLDFVNAYLKI
jgi:AcrR family transcriptional regulator